MTTDRRDSDPDTEALATTIGLLCLGEISLGNAAERTGISRWEMREILDELGVEVRLGPLTWLTHGKQSTRFGTSTEI